jgi:hypothetical protein
VEWILKEGKSGFLFEKQEDTEQNDEPDGCVESDEQECGEVTVSTFDVFGKVFKSQVNS